MARQKLYSELIRLIKEDTNSADQATSDEFVRDTWSAHTFHIITDGPEVTIEGSMDGINWTSLGVQTTVSQFVDVKMKPLLIRASRSAVDGTVQVWCNSYANTSI